MLTQKSFRSAFRRQSIERQEEEEEEEEEEEAEAEECFKATSDE
jgi:hypothetical protein